MELSTFARVNNQNSCHFSPLIVSQMALPLFKNKLNLVIHRGKLFKCITKVS